MLEKYSHIQTQLPYLSHLVLLSTLMIGMVIGFIVNSFSHQHHEPESCAIEYISPDEILGLEKARVARTKGKQLFFGKTREAISLIQNIAKTRGNSGSHVIFTKGAYVKGKGVYSISEEVHSEVLQALRNSMESDKQGDAEEGGELDVNEEEGGDEGNVGDENNAKDVISPTMKLLNQLDKGEKWQDLQ